MGQYISRVTEDLLTQWAMWCNSDRVTDLGFPSVCVIVPAKHRRSSRKKYSLTITDKEAMRIDATLAKLSIRSEETARAVIFFFFFRRNLAKTARIMKINLRKANILVNAGVAWVDAIYFKE